ncbi:GlxA family transcriptional regulator [Larsenimonas rhizosphaerae]|uniref:GlxA family transcriptional regulator n=1 Tax=Larsenimonas rhizosphaerae TaxID=2944682 RepID=A0AA42CYP4_9GAMM|nr:GlxA family transcriptional regulator [Larsenimonas rhizosphaerae]MCM2131213.1 GlxA family transcriptional regulator [Larsenimonas rhizosphaerae]MCX2525428.1 GlxA family transcriptional regulator [Larsenimonas rhizosphaerae]
MPPDVYASPKVPLSVGFVLLQRFTMLPFSAFVDCLRLAADDGDRSRQVHCKWRFMTSDGKDVTSSNGAIMTGCEPLAEPERFDYIVVIGGVLSEDDQQDQQALDYLRLAATRQVPLIGVCTGVFSLIQAGLMEGRRCCVSWYHHRDLASRYPAIEPVADRLYLDDGDRLTCAGGIASADLASYLVERHLGRSWARKSLHIMLIDEPREGAHPQPQPVVFNRVADPMVRRAISMFEQHLGTILTVDELAGRLGTSRRSLERRFKEQLGISPQKFARDLRLRYGYWLLSYTQSSVTDIGDRCGFSDTAHFSRHFRDAFGVSPSEIRKLPKSARSPLVDPFFLHIGDDTAR